jgi:hypothetical protein
MKTLREFLSDNELLEIKCYTTYSELNDYPEYMYTNIEQVIENALYEDPTVIFYCPEVIVHHITDYAEYFLWYENEDVYIVEFEDEELNHYIEDDIDIFLLINKFYKDGLSISQIMEFLKL